ncbi:hypothetical protein Tco_0716861 [Tanacetum coccineum]
MKIVVLWNPSVRKLVVIIISNSLLPSTGLTYIGFGVCPNTSNLKLVRINTIGYPTVLNWEVEVLTLRTRVWKRKGLLGPRGGRCGGNGGRGGFMDGRGGRSSRKSKNACEEVGGVKKISSMGSKFMVRGGECLKGYVGAGRGELNGGGDDFGVSKSFLGEIPGVVISESGGEIFGDDGGAVW